MSSSGKYDTGGTLVDDRIYTTNRTFLLRHAHPEIDLTSPPETWSLSERGKKQAEELAFNTTLSSIKYIFSSPEKKALETVTPLSRVLDISPIEVHDLQEAKLDQMYTEEEFFAIKEMKFLDPELAIGEAHSVAQSRIVNAIENIRRHVGSENCLIVTHGTVMTLYLNYLRGYTAEQMIALWKAMKMCHLEEI